MALRLLESNAPVDGRTMWHPNHNIRRRGRGQPTGCRRVRRQQDVVGSQADAGIAEHLEGDWRVRLGSIGQNQIAVCTVRGRYGTDAISDQRYRRRLERNVALSRFPSRGGEDGASNRQVTRQLYGAWLAGQPGAEVNFRSTLRFQVDGLRTGRGERPLDAKCRDRDGCSNRAGVGDCEATDAVSIRYGRNHDRGRRSSGAHLPVSPGRRLLETLQHAGNGGDSARTGPNGNRQWPLGLHQRADRDGPCTSAGYGDVGTAGHGDPTIATEESQVDHRL